MFGLFGSSIQDFENSDDAAQNLVAAEWSRSFCGHFVRMGYSHFHGVVPAQRTIP
jgi:hypothetical protein